MSSWFWLVGAAATAAGAFLVGWPTWRSARARAVRDLNAERYLAWRGRADRGPRASGVTRSERRRLVVAGLLGLVAIFCLVGFLSYA